jgi:hypothetical protein
MNGFSNSLLGTVLSMCQPLGFARASRNEHRSEGAGSPRQDHLVGKSLISAQRRLLCFLSFISQWPFSAAIQPARLSHSMLRLVGRPHEAHLSRELRAFVTVAYFAAAAFLISTAISRARKLPPRARVKQRCRGGCPAVRFDCACFVTQRLRSNPAKASIRATAWVTMASRVRRGDLRNIAEPSQRMAIARFARTISAIA